MQLEYTNILKSIKRRKIFLLDICEDILLGHLPTKLSFLMHSFLKSGKDSTFIAEVIGARKRENGLFVPWTLIFVSGGKSTGKRTTQGQRVPGTHEVEVSGTALVMKAYLEEGEYRSKLYVIIVIVIIIIIIQRLLN